MIVHSCLKVLKRHLQHEEKQHERQYKNGKRRSPLRSRTRDTNSVRGPKRQTVSRVPKTRCEP